MAIDWTEFEPVQPDWNDFEPLSKEEQKDELRKQMEQVRAERKPTEFLESAARAGEAIVEPLTAAGMMNQPFRLLGKPDVYKAGQPLVNIPQPSGTGFLSGVGQLIAGALSGLTTPEMIVSAPAFAQSALARALTAGEMASQLPEQISQAGETFRAPEATTAQKVVAGGQPLINALMIRGLGRTGQWLPEPPTPLPLSEPRVLEYPPLAETTTKKGPEYARSQQKTETVHGDLRTPPVESAEQVPVEEGSARIRSETEGRLPNAEAQQSRVLLTPEEQAAEQAALSEALGQTEPQKPVEPESREYRIATGKETPKVEDFLSQQQSLEIEQNRTLINDYQVKIDALEKRKIASSDRYEKYTLEQGIKRFKKLQRESSKRVDEIFGQAKRAYEAQSEPATPLPGTPPTEATPAVKPSSPTLAEPAAQGSPAQVAGAISEATPKAPVAQEGVARPAATTSEVLGMPVEQSMGGAVTAEYEQPGTYVSNMFVAIDKDRAEMGKPPMQKAPGRTWDEDNQRALAQMNRDPNWIPNLLREVTEKPRPLMSWENAGIVWHRAKLKAEANNAYARINRAWEDGNAGALEEAKVDAARFEDELLAVDKAVGRGGTGSEAGRTLRAQRMFSGPDFTLIEMRLAKRAAKGGAPLTAEEETHISNLHKRLEEAEAAHARYVADTTARLAEAEMRAKMAEMRNETPQEPMPPKVIIQVAERIVKQLDMRADAARARIRERMKTMSAGVDPTILLDLAEIGASHIGHIGLDFAKWSVKMAEDVGDWVKPHLDEVFKESQRRLDAFADRVTKSEKVKRTIKKETPEQQEAGYVSAIKEKMDNGEKGNVSYYLNRLAKVFYERGIRDRDQMLNALHGVMQSIDPTMTRRETMDAWSGYGDYRQLTKDEMSVALRGMKGELQQIAKLEDMAQGTPPLKSGTERRTPTDAERQLIRLVNDAKVKFQVPVQDPNTQLKSALDTLKTTLRNRIVDYQDRMARKDFAPRPRRAIILDKEAQRLKAESERVKQQFQRELEKDRLAKRKPWQKKLDAFVRWERAFKLSSPVVFGKLTGAALTRIITTGTEEVVGAGLSKLPGISKIAKQAPREGGIHVDAMAKAISEAINSGIDDAIKTAKTGKTDLDVLLGDRGGIDPDWSNFFGQLHGMMKAPIKRAEYTLSLEKRLRHAIANGIDVTDPMVQTRLMTEALNDGYRAIFMQHGFTADQFSTLVNAMEQSKRYPIAGEVAARLSRFLFPVVRVPINIVSETATGAAGIPIASTRALIHTMRGGIENAFPEITDPVLRQQRQSQLADSIMRQFKKGSIGAALMAIGYLSPQVVGGYNWREKRKKGSVKVSGFQIPALAGVPGFGENGDVPRWLTHAPWFELMQMGATIRHMKDSHVKGASIPEGAWAASFGLLEETPFFDEMLRFAKLPEGESTRTRFFGELAKGTIVPQALATTAKMFDEEGRKPAPKTVLQNVATGIPGLRQMVQTKAKRPGDY